LGDEKKAVEQFKYSADLAPKNISAQYRLAEHYEDIRDWDKAKRLYLIILSIDDQQAKAHKQLALIYERDEKYGLALYHWQKYAEINPKDQEVAAHITELRKPLLSKKQIDQLENERKMKEAEMQQVTPTVAVSSSVAADKGNPPNPPDSNSSANVPAPASSVAVGVPAIQSEQPVGVAPIDTGASSNQSVNVAPVNTNVSSTANQPVAVASMDAGNNPVPATAPADASPAGLVPVGDAPTPTPSQGNVPSLPK
jgi:hypothetical protein